VGRPTEVRRTPDALLDIDLRHLHRIHAYRISISPPAYLHLPTPPAAPPRDISVHAMHMTLTRIVVTDDLPFSASTAAKGYSATTTFPGLPGIGNGCVFFVPATYAHAATCLPHHVPRHLHKHVVPFCRTTAPSYDLGMPWTSPAGPLPHYLRRCAMLYLHLPDIIAHTLPFLSAVRWRAGVYGSTYSVSMLPTATCYGRRRYRALVDEAKIYRRTCHNDLEQATTRYSATIFGRHAAWACRRADTDLAGCCSGRVVLPSRWTACSMWSLTNASRTVTILYLQIPLWKVCHHLKEKIRSSWTTTFPPCPAVAPASGRKVVHSGCYNTKTPTYPKLPTATNTITV